MNLRKLNAMIQLKEEFEILINKPKENLGFNVGLPNDNDIFKWRVDLIAPRDNPYEGGFYLVLMHFPDDYPNSPPKVRFVTPIYHLNVNPKRNNSEPPGNVCLSILSRWNPDFKVEDIIVSLYSLFYMTNPESPFSFQRENEYRNNRTLYEEKIKYFTYKYANTSNPRFGYNPRYLNEWDFSYNP